MLIFASNLSEHITYTVSQAKVAQSSELYQQHVSQWVLVTLSRDELASILDYTIFYFWTPHHTFLFRLHILVRREAGNHPNCSTAAGWRGEGKQRSVTRGRSSNDMNDRCVWRIKNKQLAWATGDRCRLLRNSSASLSRSTQR